ncbi:FadR/GntR family transcriptional regulator [Halalkalibacter akibai]|uniref:Transcriptional regulator n=1 Tax=Halalkalibacter akibai (strain ATCC 43226 / DSM 21942 / CIP 109018 / JCM 9157 / 1139) TaxID=1236973 RepID=W4QPT4_HALA3|nr:transcriptional regulator [Halalkalibacter akibai JCM 9157]
MIETRRGEGTYIKPFGSYRLVEILLSFLLKDENARKDLTETRRIIELEALKLACDRITEEYIEKLYQLLVQAKEEWAHGDLPVEEDYLFHRTIVEACDNRLLLNLWVSLVEYNKVAIERSLKREGRMSLALIEHENIYLALKKRDCKQAMLAMSRHLENSRF